MDLSRRELLTYTASALLLANCKTCEKVADNIANRPTRRDITTLPPSDPILEAFREAVTKMKALPETDRRNWLRQAQIHFDHCPHGNWLFLPWHRVYLYQFEEICRELTGMKDFALPYWNWAKDKQIPGAFWGEGNALFEPERVATASSTNIISAVEVNSILDEANFLVFGSEDIPLSAGRRTRAGYGRLEGGPHNYIHGFVSGLMGGFWSPRDPIFWTHHNMVEACWYEWNFVRDRLNTDSNDWLDRTFTEFCDRHGDPVEVPVRGSLLYPVLAYQFDALDLGLPAPPMPRVMRREAGEEDLKKKAQKGAPMSLAFEQTFSARAQAPLAEGRPAAIRLELPRAMLAPLRAEQRSVLRVETKDVVNGRDFFARVFLNKPDANAETSTSDPSYVGSIALFGEDHAHEGGNPRFLLDPSEAMQRLQIREAPELNVVLIPHRDRPAGARSMSLGEVTLGILNRGAQTPDR